MNNIVYDESLNIICLIVLNVVILVNLKSSIYTAKRFYTGYFFLWVFITAFSLYYRPIDGDFWYSLLEFNGHGNMYKEHMEPFYVWLKEFLAYNYLFWRFIVWGLAGIFVILIYKSYKIHPALATVSFLTFGLLHSFYYMRNALGFGILYYAVASYLSNQNQSFSKRLFGLLFVSGISYFFHRSMPLYIFLSFIVLFVPINKKIVFSLAILFPFLYGIISYLAIFIMSMGLWQDDGGSYYLEQANTFTANWKGVVSLCIEYLPFVYITYYYIKFDILSTDKDAYARKVFFLLYFFLFYISFLFTGQGANDLAMRLGDSAMYPFAIFIALYFKKYAPNRQCVYFSLLVAFSTLWTFIFVR